MASADLRKELECSICLSIYRDPVMLECGHNYCRVCIDRVLEKQERYICPECREEFLERPSLHRNMKLCNVVESFLSAHPDQEEATIFCSYCVDSPVAAVKSCTHCEASLCEKHLRFHNKSLEHVIIDPMPSLGSIKCPIHKKTLEYYCTEDATCICVSCCLAGEHRGHHVEIFTEASENKKKELRQVLQNLSTTLGETESEIQKLREFRKQVEGAAAERREQVTATFRDLQRQLQDLEKKVLSKLSQQVEQASLLVSDMETRKDELARKMHLIEDLCKVTDPLTVLRESGDLCDAEGRDKDRKLLGDEEDLDTTGVSHAVLTLSHIIREVNVGFYVQGAADVTLDVDTAHNSLQISEDRREARYGMSRCHPVTQGRFQGSYQVMSTQSFSSGRHYWEVDVGGSQSWSVGVCYPSIERSGYAVTIGDNNKSWCLYRNGCQYGVKHNNGQIQLSPGISGNRVRIYLDYEAGRLHFYDLCDQKRHVHTFTATFTEPLHAALSVYGGSIKIYRGDQDV